MQYLDMASMFGRHEFLIRRLHSLLGLVPIGGYLVFHLATNGAIIDGLEAYQHRADQIHKLGATTILILEWTLIFLPILFHGLIGMVIVTRGKRNVSDYSYEGNIRYTLQRLTGVVAFVFIFWHVFQMHGWLRWEWWVQYVARPLGGAAFDPERAYTAAEVIQSFWLFPVLYAAGTMASVYHLANGAWTMGITWGVWTSPRAQQWAKAPCAGIGVALAVVGMGALWAMLRAEAPAAEAAAPAASETRDAAGPPPSSASQGMESAKCKMANVKRLPPRSEAPLRNAPDGNPASQSVTRSFAGAGSQAGAWEPDRDSVLDFALCTSHFSFYILHSLPLASPSA